MRREPKPVKWITTTARSDSSSTSRPPLEQSSGARQALHFLRVHMTSIGEEAMGKWSPTAQVPSDYRFRWDAITWRPKHQNS